MKLIINICSVILAIGISLLGEAEGGGENHKLRLDVMKQQSTNNVPQNPKEIELKFQNFEQKFDKLQDRLREQQQRHHNELKELLGSLKGKECHQERKTDKSELLKELQKSGKLQQNILAKLDSKCQTIEMDSSASVSGRSEAAEAAGSENELVEVDQVNVCWDIYTKTLGELSGNLTVLQNIDKKLGKFNGQYGQESEKHKKLLDMSQGLLKFVNHKEDSKICVKSEDQKLMCTEEPHPTSCQAYDSSHCSRNTCRIKNFLYGPEIFVVACDDATDGGGWTVFQRRLNGSVDFYRSWSEYKSGFGHPEGEFWLGLDKLHVLTTTLAPVELLIQLGDHKDVMKYAKYGKFAIGNETELYVLKEAGDYEGNAGDSFSQHKGQKFTTKDKDNDGSYRVNCAENKKGAWWYKSCMWSHLNGMYYKNGEVPKDVDGNGINWYNFHGYDYSLKFVQMMIRTKRS